MKISAISIWSPAALSNETWEHSMTSAARRSDFSQSFRELKTVLTVEDGGCVYVYAEPTGLSSAGTFVLVKQNPAGVWSKKFSASATPATVTPPEGSDRLPTKYGTLCGNGAPTRTTNTSNITEAAASWFVRNGCDLKTFSRIWASVPRVSPSTGVSPTGTTKKKIAAG